MKKVTVVIITYNHEKTIEETIKSVLAQETDYAVEIAVFDDASTDGTSEIIRRLSREYPDRIRATIREKNLGAKNNVLDAIATLNGNSGNYVACVEGDDYWTDMRKIQKQTKFLDENLGYSAVYHQFTIIDEKGKENVKEQVYKGEEYTKYELENYELPGQTATLVARNFFKDPEILKLFLKNAKKLQATPFDRLYPIFFLKFGRIKSLPDNMSVYRMCFNEDSNSWTSKNRKSWNRYRLMESIWRREMEKFSRDIGFPISFFYFNNKCFSEDLQTAFKNHNLNSYAFVFLTFMINRGRFSMLNHAIKGRKMLD